MAKSNKWLWINRFLRGYLSRDSTLLKDSLSAVITALQYFSDIVSKIRAKKLVMLTVIIIIYRINFLKNSYFFEKSVSVIS